MVQDYLLMTQLYLENSMEILARKLSDKKLKTHFDRDLNDVLPVIKRWQSQGLIREEKPENDYRLAALTSAIISS